MINWISCNDELPKEEGVEYIVCASGTIGNVTYDRAVLTDVWYEEGRWYLNGVYRSELVVHAWMPLPEPYIV